MIIQKINQAETAKQTVTQGAGKNVGLKENKIMILIDNRNDDNYR